MSSERNTSRGMFASVRALLGALAVLQLVRSAFLTRRRAETTEDLPAPDAGDEVPEPAAGPATPEPDPAPRWAAPDEEPRRPPPPSDRGADRRAGDGPPDRTTLVWRAKGIIIAVAVVAGAATLGICMVLPATYRATATVRVAAQSGSTSQEAVLASNDLASQYAQLVTSAPVVRGSEEELGLAPGALNGKVSGGTLGEQNLIGVSVEGPDARAVGIQADTVAAHLVTELEKANRDQAAAYARRVDQQLAPLDRRIKDARAEIDRLSAQVAEGGARGAAAATILASRQSNLSSLESQRDQVASNVAQVAAVVQPTVSVWSQAGYGSKIQPKPVLYTVVAVIVAALVTAQIVVIVGSRRGRGAS